MITIRSYYDNLNNSHIFLHATKSVASELERKVGNSRRYSHNIMLQMKTKSLDQINNCKESIRVNENKEIIKGK